MDGTVTDYGAFLARKSQLGGMSGFDPLWMPSFLFDFQRSLVEWAVRKGRAAIFADCGLGKTPMQLVWAENVCRMTDKPVLIMTPHDAEALLNRLAAAIRPVLDASDDPALAPAYAVAEEQGVTRNEVRAGKVALAEWDAMGLGERVTAVDVVEMAQGEGAGRWWR